VNGGYGTGSGNRLLTDGVYAYKQKDDRLNPKQNRSSFPTLIPKLTIHKNQGFTIQKRCHLQHRRHQITKQKSTQRLTPHSLSQTSRIHRSRPRRPQHHPTLAIAMPSLSLWLLVLTCCNRRKLRDRSLWLQSRTPSL
jgi:hypothetical protein